MEKRRKLSRKIIRVLLTFMLLVTSMEVSVPAAPRITIREGKVYQNNKPVTNKIVGSKAKGYYYVDKTGRKVNTREIRQAVDFVMRNSKAGDSRAKRLKACYRALQTYPYFGMTNRAPKAKNLSSYARYMFSRHRGDCYYYASTMAYIARAHLDRNLCLVTRKKYPFRLRCDKVYTMTVKKAKVKWS